MKIRTRSKIFARSSLYIGNTHTKRMQYCKDLVVAYWSVGNVDGMFHVEIANVRNRIDGGVEWRIMVMQTVGGLCKQKLCKS